MKSFFTRIKLTAFITAILTIALGVVLIMYPAETMLIAVRIVGGFLLLLGGVGAVSGFISDNHGKVFMIGSLIIAFLGVWLLAMPQTAASLIPMFMGVVLVIDALEDFKLAYEAKTHEASGWVYQILVGVIGIVMGVVCICKAFGVMEFAVIFIGVFLIFDGVTDFYVIFKTIRAVRAYEQAAKTAEAIDVEYEEVIGDKTGADFGADAESDSGESDSTAINVYDA